MLELAPYSLSEVEQHLYQTHRVEYDDLPDEMKNAVGRLVHEATTDYDSYWSKTASRQEALDHRLKHFNHNRVQKYTSGLLQEAKVCGVVNSKDSYDYDVWVEFTGVTQKEFDRLPESIKVQLYDRYMTGYAEFRDRNRLDPNLALETIQKTLKDALKGFIGHKITPRVLETMKRAIKNTLLVDEIDGPFKDHNGHDYYRLSIEHEDQHSVLIIYFMIF